MVLLERIAQSAQQPLAQIRNGLRIRRVLQCGHPRFVCPLDGRHLAPSCSCGTVPVRDSPDAQPHYRPRTAPSRRQAKTKHACRATAFGASAAVCNTREPQNLRVRTRASERARQNASARTSDAEPFARCGNLAKHPRRCTRPLGCPSDFRIISGKHGQTWAGAPCVGRTWSSPAAAERRRHSELAPPGWAKCNFALRQPCERTVLRKSDAHLPGFAGA